LSHRNGGGIRGVIGSGTGAGGSRLLQRDMWSGWGIRTLSKQNPDYNPLSYQCGSVWPHDNRIIAIGFKQYGFAEEAARIAHAVSDVGSYFALYQMPELYAGIEREDSNFSGPVPRRQCAAGLGGRLSIHIAAGADRL
jgi:glycogen debranching enzyme